MNTYRSPSALLTAASIIVLITVATWEPISCQHHGNGVRLFLGGVEYPDNATVNILDIGEGDKALICRTNKTDCCVYNRLGEWYFPNGSLVRIQHSGDGFYRNRGDNGIVRLNRRHNDVINPLGTFHCEVPDANGINRTIHIGLIRDGHHGNVIKHLSLNSTNSAVTCTTSGGPASLVYSENINNFNEKRVNRTTKQLKITVDPANSVYNNMLRVDQLSTESYYVCVTRNGEQTSLAILLSTERSQGESSQVVGRIGERLTLLCLAADGQVQSASWTGGRTSTNNITFANLSASNAGMYTCRGDRRQGSSGVVSHSLNLAVSGCSAVVYIRSSESWRAIVVGQNYMFTCEATVWGTACAVETYFIFRESRLVSTNRTVEFRLLKLSDISLYTCIVTLAGYNFTSRPAFMPQISQIPVPEVDISSDMDNPVSLGSHPTLTCTIVLDATVDIEVQIDVSWSGPVYGFGEYTVTAPVVNSTAEVPTFTSTAALNADESFYDSGEYSCTAVVSSVSYQDFIRSSNATSGRIPVLFEVPRRPTLHRVRTGTEWVHLEWSINSADNITSFEVKYSYVGECSSVGRGTVIRGINGSESSYNITGLGEYFNYSVNLTALNGTGRSPPFIEFALTKPTTSSQPPSRFQATHVHSTNITVQWERVACEHRNSEIVGYILRYSLNGTEEGTELRVEGVGDEDRQYTVLRLQPRSRYTLTIAAVNSEGQSGPSSSTTVDTAAPENVPFQVQLTGVHSCLQWRISDPEVKVHDIKEGVVEGINQHCPYCAITSDDITEAEFVCFPGSPNQVTFRGKVQDRAAATAREVISFVEIWTMSSSHVTIPVHHARLNVNSTCIALLASLDDIECPGYLVPTTTTTEQEMPTTHGHNTTTQPQLVTTLTEENPNIVGSSQSDTGAIVGGVVAITLILTVGVSLVILVWLILKYRTKTGYSIGDKILAGKVATKSNDANEEAYVDIEKRATVMEHSQQGLVDRYSKIPSSTQVEEENPEVEAIYEL